MRVQLVAGAAILVMGAVHGPASTQATLAAAEQRSAAQAQQTDFTRPDVVPLPAEGKFQVVSETPWPGAKVRMFFLGAQF